MILFVLKNKTLILIAAIVLLILSISGLMWKLDNEIKQKNRHKNNYNAAQTDLLRFKDKNGADAIMIQEQQLTLRELKQSNDSSKQILLQLIRELGNKDKQIEQLVSVKTKTIYKDVHIPIYDTTFIYKEDTISRISSIKNKWLDAYIIVKPNELILLEYESRDEVIILLKWYKIGSWFLPKWFEKRKYAADIKSLNQNSIITQAQNVRITGKRGR